MNSQARRPKVICNFAITADGKVSTRNFTPTGFTSPADKKRLLEIRSLGDAVLVGGRTVAADSMSMTLPDPELRRRRLARGKPPEPLRVIAANRGRLSVESKVFRTGLRPPVIFATLGISERQRRLLAPLSDLWILPGEEVSLSALLGILYSDYGVRTVVCEGGPSLFRALLTAGAVDELRLTWAPLVFGGAQAPTLTGLPGLRFPASVRARLHRMETIGAECFLTYRFEKG